MKPLKSIPLLLAIILLLSGCTSSSPSGSRASNPTPIIIYATPQVIYATYPPTEKPTAQPTARPTSLRGPLSVVANVTAIPAYTQAPSTSAAQDYVLNKNTKKFHYPNCSSVNDMKQKNRMDVHLTREQIINQGYTPCKRCNP